jgi:hypothetical protein
VGFSDYELTTIIGYSLSSSEYTKEIKQLRQRSQLQRALKQKFQDSSSEIEETITTTQSKMKVQTIRMRRDSKGRLGIRFDPYMMVCGVSDWAHKAGMRVGQKIVGCEGIQISSHADLVSSIPSQGDHRAFSLHVEYDVEALKSLSSMRSVSSFKSTTSSNSKDGDLLISGIQDKISNIFRDQETNTKLECHSYFPLQFEALRRVYLRGGNRQYLESLSRCAQWKAKGGKSGALFLRTLDNRFVIKDVKDTELRNFNTIAGEYFRHMKNALFEDVPTILAKIVGIYEIKVGSRYHFRFIVMENLSFSCSHISRAFDLKGSRTNRHIEVSSEEQNNEEVALSHQDDDDDDNDDEDNSTKDIDMPSTSSSNVSSVLLDQNFMEYTSGFPLPLTRRAKGFLRRCIANDTSFLAKCNVMDYSMLVLIDETTKQVSVGIIDYMRTYDFVKLLESHGKRIAAKHMPTIVAPPRYQSRFQFAMDRYFMGVHEDEVVTGVVEEEEEKNKIESKENEEKSSKESS